MKTGKMTWLETRGSRESQAHESHSTQSTSRALLTVTAVHNIELSTEYIGSPTINKLKNSAQSWARWWWWSWWWLMHCIHHSTSLAATFRFQAVSCLRGMCGHDSLVSFQYQSIINCAEHQYGVYPRDSAVLCILHGYVPWGLGRMWKQKKGGGKQGKTTIIIRGKKCIEKDPWHPETRLPILRIKRYRKETACLRVLRASLGLSWYAADISRIFSLQNPLGDISSQLTSKFSGNLNKGHPPDGRRGGINQLFWQLRGKAMISAQESLLSGNSFLIGMHHFSRGHFSFSPLALLLFVSKSHPDHENDRGY